MKKIELYAGKSENIWVLKKVKISNCRQSAGKARIMLLFIRSNKIGGFK